MDRTGSSLLVNWEGNGLLKKKAGRVKPVLRDHPTVQERVVDIVQWSLKRGSTEDTDFPKF